MFFLFCFVCLFLTGAIVVFKNMLIVELSYVTEWHKKIIYLGYTQVWKIIVVSLHWPIFYNFVLAIRILQ